MVLISIQRMISRLVFQKMFGCLNGGHGGLHPRLMKLTPKPDGCLVHNMSSIVVLMDTIVSGKPHQVCEISSTQGIMIPLWTAFFEDSLPKYDNYTYEQLSKAAREVGDPGAITSLVKLDGKPVVSLM